MAAPFQPSTLPLQTSTFVIAKRGTGSGLGGRMAVDDRGDLRAERIARRYEAKALLDALPKAAPLEWALDPTELALDASKWRNEELPGAFCLELGRRILLAQLQQSEWVLRRVEKVAFQRDRSVSREIALELLVRPDAPVFRSGSADPQWLVPLSSMMRRTLVNLDLRDEDGKSLTTPGIRVVQSLEESVLLAAAAATDPAGCADPESYVRTFVRDVVAGRRDQVAARVRAIRGKTVPPPLAQLSQDDLFMWTLDRMSRSYTLFVLLPVVSGRHRLLRMSFDEATHWRYQVPDLEQPAAGGGDSEVSYKTGKRVPWYELTHSAAAYGLRPTRVRFQVPGAETAASYHFEAVAPHGVRIARAGLVAGRPNDLPGDGSLDTVASDTVVGHSPIVGLHAIEVPNGSCCRVQLDLVIPTRGWLTTVLLTSWVICAVLAAMGPLFTSRSWRNDELINAVLVLATTSAGVATLVAQRDFGGVAARFVSRLRALGAVIATLPVVQAGLLVYTDLLDRPQQRVAAATLLGVAVLIAMMISTAWVTSYVAERREEVRSPWDMTEDEDLEASPRKLEPPPGDFWEAVERYQFGSAAVGIRSAEAWYQRYRWTDGKQRHAVLALTAMTSAELGPPCPDYRTECASGRGCPARTGSPSPKIRPPD